MRVTRSYIVIFALLGSCLICKGQDLKVDSVSVDNADKVTYTAGGTAQTISVTVKVTETTVGGGGNNGAVNKLHVYFSDRAEFHDTDTVHSTGVEHEVDPPKTIPSGDTEDVVEVIPGIEIDVANCQAYTHVCVVITDDGAVTDGDDYDCLPFGATVGTHAGTKVCPDLASGLLTIKSPETGLDCSTATSVTFDLHVCDVDGSGGTITGIDFYYTNNEDFDEADKKSATPISFDPKEEITVDGEHTFEDEVVELAVDASCEDFSYLCAVLKITTDTDPENDHSCVQLDLEEKSTYHCPDVSAEKFEVKDPDPAEISYNPTEDTEIEFEIEAGAEIEDGTISGVEIYFTDNKDFYADEIIKSDKFDATEVDPKTITEDKNVDVKGKASVKPDEENCRKYTHMCGLLLVTSTDTITDNNVQCIPTDKDNAGVIDCGDSAAAVIGVGKYSVLASVIFVLASYLF